MAGAAVSGLQQRSDAEPAVRGNRVDGGSVGGVRRRRRGERGSVLLVTVLLAAAGAAMSAALLESARSVALEFRARRDVLCARYAALGGLALGAPTAPDGSAVTLVGGDADSLVVSRVLVAPNWCVLRATAACGGAVRTLERTLDDPSPCTPP